MTSGERPVVTVAFLVLCVVATVAVTVVPHLNGVIGGIAPREHPWQPFTAAFVHGWPGFPAPIHLALDVFLMLVCGVPCERLLGHGWFLLLGGVSLAVNAAVLSMTDGTNGSSLVIWSWGMPLLVALVAARSRDASVTRTDAYVRIRGVLILMYVVVPAVMTFVPYAFGWRGNPLIGFLRANVFHLTAAAVGALVAVLLRDRIRHRLYRLALSGSRV